MEEIPVKTITTRDGVLRVLLLANTDSPVFHRDHKQRVAGWPWACDWLRQWLRECELWDTLEALSPDRLVRLGEIVKRQVVKAHL